jgi:hypothetical protein
MEIQVESTDVRLARIETKIDTLLSSKADHETRIRAVEKRSWYVGGAAMLLSIFAPSLLKHF